jgi:tagatose-6-phosphate ketose/aldose isomerase
VRHLEIEDSVLAERRAGWTAREIEQQPRAWMRTQEVLQRQAAVIDAFLQPLLAKDNLRIILTGAGSSAYIGQCLAPHLLSVSRRRVEAIATTELVSGPRDYLQKEIPTLLVSFGRSGNSPESIAAVEIAEQLVDECYQLVFTCNREGELYTRCSGQPNSLAILLPEETHDRSFAMTSSFSSMLFAGLRTLGGHGTNGNSTAKVAAASAAVIARFNARLKSLAAENHQRVVYLGSKGLMGLAHEASLKLLELTDGVVVTMANSPLGFRHGPKTIVNHSTLIVMFMSNDPLTRKYDLDLLRELRGDAIAAKILVLTARSDAATDGADHLLIPEMSTADDSELMFPYVICAQLYAFHRALHLGNSPDSPSATGTVNRVVRGVTIHSA